jgi:uncharacterized Tic20 family protein
VVEAVKATAPQQAGETRKLEAGAAAPQPRRRRGETKKLDAEPEAPPMAVAVSPHLGLSYQELNWAAVAHASILITLLLGLVTGGVAVVLGPIIPGLIWYTHRNKSAYVAEQARQATIFQLAGIAALLALATAGAILIAVGWVVSAILVVLLVGLILLPLMLIVTLLWVLAFVALPIAQVIYGCYAAIEAHNGRPFRYWWIGDLIDRYQSQT